LAFDEEQNPVNDEVDSKGKKCEKFQTAIVENVVSAVVKVYRVYKDDNAEENPNKFASDAYD
jgi:hypothetical protein